MIEHRHASEERISADMLHRTLCQIAHHDAVVIRAWRLTRESIEEWLIWMRELKELEMGGDTEDAPQHAEREEGEAGRQASVGDRVPERGAGLMATPRFPRTSANRIALAKTDTATLIPAHRNVMVRSARQMTPRLRRRR